MGILQRFKKSDQPAAQPKQQAKEVPSVNTVITKPVAGKVAKSESVAPKAASGEIKGKSTASYHVLLKPLITEKATYLGANNQYVFAVDPRMNKIEVKKAIRTIYNVNPLGVNMIHFSGKLAGYGRIRGRRKAWKKAVVTLRAGDKIQVYEGI